MQHLTLQVITHHNIRYSISYIVFIPNFMVGNFLYKHQTRCTELRIQNRVDKEILKSLEIIKNECERFLKIIFFLEATYFSSSKMFVWAIYRN